MNGSLFLCYNMVMQLKQQLSNEKMLTDRHSYLKSPHISKIWIFPKFGVCETLRKIKIIFAKLKFKSLQNLHCAKCFANCRFPKSGVCEICHKVQIFSAKSQSKCIQNMEFTKYFANSILIISSQNILQIPDFYNLEFAKYFAKSRPFCKAKV